MKTGNIGGTNPYSNYQNAVKSGKNHKQAANEMWKPPIDTFTPSEALKGAAADPAKLDQLWRDTNHAGDAVRKLLASALGKEDASGQGFWAARSANIKLSEADRAQAQQLISEDGFFGIKKTTERIMDFAKALIGEGASETQIDRMRDAVKKGFDEVARLFGGFDKLPEITKQTYEAIMKAFDEWKGSDAVE
ncbi:MAG: hypothetical protein LBD23_10670 [Oscillospiraceae bacterium]|jgi:hypothetical protein|nr:hypothetical protein [Oscillospiraceae bacterium]